MLKKTALALTTLFSLIACNNSNSQNSNAQQSSTSQATSVAQTSSQNDLLNKINNKETLIVGTMGTYAPIVP
ncbi:MAG: amino acid ABC transporter substrate-binding protein, partial [Kingella sp. (in: b-proteobacteria)]